MKIVISDSSFQDFSRVGYDYSYPTYSVESGDSAKNGNEFVLPEHFTIEKARKVGERMIKYMLDGYGNLSSFNRAMKDFGESV